MSVIELIKKYNQPVYLHLHPNYVSGDEDRWFLWQYTHDEKKDILKKGFEYFEELTGEKSKFFRIGCYGADDDMYKALDELGLKVVDLSYCYNNPSMCHVSSESIGSNNIPKSFCNQTVFPNTRFVSFKLGSSMKCLNLDASETTFREWKYYLRHTRLSQLTCTMHSWNFIKKYFFDGEYVKLDVGNVKKFKKMVRYAKEGFVFARLDEDSPVLGKDNDELIDMTKGAKGKVTMLFDNFVRFRKIARLNKKYFILYRIFDTIALLTGSGIIALILYFLLR